MPFTAVGLHKLHRPIDISLFQNSLRLLGLCHVELVTKILTFHVLNYSHQFAVPSLLEVKGKHGTGRFSRYNRKYT